MVTGGVGKSFANEMLFLANILNTVTINKLVVPELVQAGNSATLDCRYTVVDERFTLRWLFNHSEVVYEWRPGTEPKVGGVLDGRLDLDYKISNTSTQERRALRIVQSVPELSGEYTCRISGDDGAEASETAAMLVYSPESEFILDVHTEHVNGSDVLNIHCTAHGLYPQPDLTLEYNHWPVARQQLRVWRTGSLFSAESAARVRAYGGRAACRLRLPPAGYSALRTRPVAGIGTKNRSNNASIKCKTTSYISIIISTAMTIEQLICRLS